jgi:bifunctional DNA-binding transcriptional regulator/antitoxin component of YhaV-PrlF toxin-antitoxin module
VAKVTSKLQVTLPKALAEQYRIKPGDDILWVASGEAIRVVPARSVTKKDSVAERLKLFDQASERVRRRYKPAKGPEPTDRGWTREELYDRGYPR